MSITITDEMQRAIDTVRAGQSIFLTGRAGTGKSTLLQHLRDNVISSQSATVAYTGVAANTIGGITIHKFFGWMIDITVDTVRSTYSPRDPRLLRNLKTLVIDEVSMLRSDLMEMIDVALRRFGPKAGSAFGGVQLILVGDPLQLPPIVATKDEAAYLQDVFGGEHFFEATCMRDFEYVTIELTKVFRQHDEEMIHRLDRIRSGEASSDDLAKFNAKQTTSRRPVTAEGEVTITPLKRVAAEINFDRLESLPGKTEHSIARVQGKVFSKPPADVDLYFKRGAQVMMLTNDRAGRWANGSLGIVEQLVPRSDDDAPHVLIHLLESGEVVQVYRHDWEVFAPKYDGEKIVQELIGSFRQFPFQLAWAVTIHKSQSRTFDKVVVDLRAPAFAPGQVYVALSRCRSLDGIRLVAPITADQVSVDERALAFLAERQLVSA